MDIFDGMIYFFITYVILVLLGIAGILILYPIYYFVTAPFAEFGSEFILD